MPAMTGVLPTSYIVTTHVHQVQTKEENELNWAQLPQYRSSSNTLLQFIYCIIRIIEAYIIIIFAHRSYTIIFFAVLHNGCILQLLAVQV